MLSLLIISLSPFSFSDSLLSSICCLFLFFCGSYLSSMNKVEKAFVLLWKYGWKNTHTVYTFASGIPQKIFPVVTLGKRIRDLELQKIPSNFIILDCLFFIILYLILFLWKNVKDWSLPFITKLKSKLFSLTPLQQYYRHPLEYRHRRHGKLPALTF